ncbi:MAG: alpha/beta fold hydrolase [Candidatus Hodarchaeota archaeon]
MRSNNSKQPQAQKISVTENIILSYYRSIDKKNLTLLFIHGLGCAKENYLPIFDHQFLTAYSMLLPDLIGHGESSKPANFSYSMDDQAKMLFKLLEALQIRGNIFILAHSMGGPIAISLAELLNDRVLGMVYAEGNIDEGDCSFSKYIAESFSREEWKKQGFNQTLKSLYDNPELKEYAQTFSKASPIALYESARDLYRVSKEESLLTRLVQLSVPVLGIFGEKNKGQYTSEEKLASKFPIHFIPEAGHGMMVENPQAFYEVINGFLKQI